jgi:predicted alpha/beta superfamily hydrolase
MVRLLFLLLFSIFSSAMAQNPVTIRITSLPEYHPTGSDIYLAGSFNGWNPKDEAFKFNKDDKGNYTLMLQLATGKYEYKATRGSWENGECKKNGTGLANRILEVEGTTATDINIEEWVDRFPAQVGKSSASKRVHIIDTAFLIPQLKRTRRVWIYLPEDYKTVRYPVLYMHDGQNLFDDLTAYSGEWGVDEFLDSIAGKACIVVGIDHGGSKRLNEYNPYDNEKFGKGEGKLYADFLVKTLKPFIDKKYRPLTDKKHTLIAGSSMGGLISLYTVLKYPNTFGGVGVFSPAFWISGTKIFDDIRTKGGKVNSAIYFFGGKLEGTSMIPDMMRAYKGMSAVSKSRLQMVIRDEGKHNEATWRHEFPAAYHWLSGR